MGPQRLCQPLPSLPSSPCLHHTHCSFSSPVTPGVGPISTHLRHCFLLRLLPQTHLLLFMRPQLSPLRSPTCHQPWSVPAIMAPLPPEHSSPSSKKGDRKGPCPQVRGEEKSVTIPGLKCALDKTENPGVLLEGLLGIRHN